MACECIYKFLSMVYYHHGKIFSPCSILHILYAAVIPLLTMQRRWSEDWIGQMWVSYFLIVLIGSSNTECDPTLFREGYNKLVGFVLPYLSLSLGRVEIHNTTSKYAYWPTNWILFSIVSIWVLLLTVFSLLFHYRCMFVCYSVVCTIPSCAVNHQDYIMM